MEWYEPGEDTYTLIDLLESEEIRDRVVVDLGCSTGAITRVLEHTNLVISMDLNATALRQLHGHTAVRADLLSGINQARIDVVVFNPPYVPDFDCPILGGGPFGREVIDRFVADVSVCLVYLLVIEANKPWEVAEALEGRGYSVAVVKMRRIIGETIVILKATK